MDAQASDNDVASIEWKTIGKIVSIVSFIPVLIFIYSASNTAYVGYHTAHVKKTIEPLFAQHTIDVESRFDATQKTATEVQAQVTQLTRQVSSLQVSAAIAAVSALQTELDRHERNPESSELWGKELARLNRQIEQAKEYRQCLIDQRRNCEELRGW